MGYLVLLASDILLENQVGEQDHAAANGWGIQVGKLATQQIGDELQLQGKQVQYSDIIMPEIISNERCKEIYLLGI
jgi:hypothetical protein